MKNTTLKKRKGGYVGGCINGEDVAEIMSKKRQSKEEEVERMLKDKREDKAKLRIIQVIPNRIVAKKKVNTSMEIRLINCLTGNCV